MRTALDSSVILDVVTGLAPFARNSENAMRQVMGAGSLVIGECVLAEISPAFAAGEIDEFLKDWNISYLPTDRRAALLAGAMFRRYLARRGVPGRVLPDFLIAAHACRNADQLLARDRGYYRDYFEDLRLTEPTKVEG